MHRSMLARAILSWHIAAAFQPCIVVAVDASEPSFVTGAALAERLHGVVSVSWSQIPLKQALQSLAETERLAIVLDRRVDPNREIRLELPREPLEDILRKVAIQARLGYCQFGPVAYFGPPDAAARLRTVAQLRLDEVRARGGAQARKLTQSRPMHWEQLSEPRQLVDDLAAEAEVAVENPQRVPHDLWAAADLPAMSWVDRLSLLLLEFDLTFELDASGKRLALKTLPERVSLSRTYRAGRNAEQLAKRWAADYPRSRIAAETGRVRVDGPWEDQEAIDRRMRGAAPQRRSPASAGKEVYQLTIESAPLDQVVAQLAERMSIEFQWDRPAIERSRIATDQLISVKVSGADAEALLTAVFRNTGFKFERRGRVVRILPAASP